MSISVVGTYHSKFERSEKNIYELLVEAGQGVLADAEIDGSLIGGIFVGNYSGGSFCNQEHFAPYAVNISPTLRFKGAVRVENACASGFAAIKAAQNALLSKDIDYALVIGVEKMTSLDSDGITNTLSKASYYPEEALKGMTFPGLFAEFAKGYMEKYHISEDLLTEALREIASKNYRNALNNPFAQMPKDITAKEIKNLPEYKNPMVAYPLRLHDCSLVSDGAAAVILTRTELINKSKNKYVEILGIEHTSDYLQLDKRNNYEFTGAKVAVDKLLKKCGQSISNIDFAEVHDCFTIAELLCYEALGIAKDGEAIQILNEGVTKVGGSFPVNPSGGLKAKGHPVGATGVSMLIAVTKQLLGMPLGAKVEGAKTGIIVNLGGSAVTTYAALCKLQDDSTGRQ